MTTWHDILSNFTIAELRDAHLVPYQTAAGWKRRGRLPSRHWHTFLDHARQRGLTYTMDDLARADGFSEVAA